MLALAATWLVAELVVPVWQVRQVLPKNSGAPDAWVDVALNGYQYAPRLGPPRAAVRKLTTYIRAPHFFAPYKKLAMHLLASCGDEGRLRIELFRKDHSPQLRLFASRALMNFRDVDPMVVNMEILSDPVPEVRIEAMDGLCEGLQVLKISDATRAAAIEALTKAAEHDPAPEVRAAAADRLRRIHSAEGPK